MTIMADRKAKIARKTNETDIKLAINLDGSGSYEINTGIGFLDHMLCHLSKHGKIDMNLSAKGDLEVDQHHTVEDVAICLGQALTDALGDKKGITRYGNSTVPMEDALASVAIDLSGRPFCVYNVQYRTEKIGDFDVVAGWPSRALGAWRASGPGRARGPRSTICSGWASGPRGTGSPGRSNGPGKAGGSGWASGPRGAVCSGWPVRASGTLASHQEQYH